MRKVLAMLICLLLANLSFSQFKLFLKFKTLSTGKIIVTDYYDSLLNRFDIKNGQAVINVSGEQGMPVKVEINGYNSGRPLLFILSKEPTAVSFDTLIRSHESGNMSALYPNRPIFSQDPNNNALLYRFIAHLNIFGDSTFNNPSLAARKAAHNLFVAISDSLVRTNRKELASSVIIDYLMVNKIVVLNGLEKFYNYLDEDIRKSWFGIKIGTELGLEGALAPGNNAPNFNAVDLRGREYSLSELAGKKILLHFWGSRCAPCIKEAPELIKFARENNNSLVVINVSNDFRKEDWHKGIEDAKIEQLINIHDGSGTIFKNYHIHGIPAYYLVDEQQKIVISKGNLEDVRSWLRQASGLTRFLSVSGI